jgi:serine/threonine-protein kinase
MEPDDEHSQSSTLHTGHNPEPGHVLGNRYRVTALIAKGGHSLVYGATNLVTGKSVAIKWPSRGVTMASVLREGQLAARVRHPALLDVYDVEQHNGTFFLVMEHVPGMPLSACLQHSSLSLGAFVRVFENVLGAVQALHRAELVHCDLKPANILVAVDDAGRLHRAKVVDFGSMRPMDRTEGGARSLAPRTLGSPHYMAPEQRLGAVTLDARSDVYGLGILLQRCMRMFCSPADELLHAALLAIAARASALEPAQRFQNVAELSRAFEASGILRVMSPWPSGDSSPQE